MKRSYILLSFLLFGSFSTMAQRNNLSKEEKKQKRKIEHKLDKSHGGIGATIYMPQFSPNVSTPTPWYDVNALFDVTELKFGFGTSFFKDNNGFLREDFGTHIYAGVNYPITLGAFGRQKSPLIVYRGHPVLAGGVGVYNFREKTKPSARFNDRVWYLGINPGYRFRFPGASIEANFNMNLDFAGKNKISVDGLHKRFTFYPSVTVRLDALKWYYNPKMVQVEGTMTTTSNHRSSSYRSGNYIYTITTYDVTVSPITMGIQDIGFHVGVGPKYSFMNPARSNHIPTSNLFGVAAESRLAILDASLVIEGGKIGHGGLLEMKNKTKKVPYKRKLNKNETTTGLGTANTFNFYGQAGIDITSMILSLAGISISKGSATSYLGLTAGVNFGLHHTWNQEFVNPSDAFTYDQRLVQNNGEAKEKFIDPRKGGFGYLGGFYISMQVGALNFKITNYKYYGAPFASTTMFSVAYRFPIYRGNH